MAENANRINKARYWWAVLWTENLEPGWEDKIADEVQVPFAYAVHDMDTDSKSEHRKDHMHLILAFSNTTTYSHALNVFKLLGEKAVNTCKAIIDIRQAYDYLIHDTDNCKKQGKYLYPVEHRVLGNGFDIGFYEQLGEEEKLEIFYELLDFVDAGGFTDMKECYRAFRKEFEGIQYLKIYQSHNAAIERHVKGNYQHWEKRKAIEKAKNQPDSCASGTRQAHEKCCPECGSLSIKKKGKTVAEQQRYQCKDCGKTFI